jgi:hypothetical protein
MPSVHADVSATPRVPVFTTLTPARVLDTRWSGTKVGNAAGTGSVLELSVLGKAGLPTSGIGAVALNVTVADGENPTVGGGFVTVFPCGVRPDASNLNFGDGQTIPNAVIAPVSNTGTICFYVYGTAHLLADVSGYFPTAPRAAFSVVDDHGKPLRRAQIQVCNRNLDPICSGYTSIHSADADGWIRVPMEPTTSYRLNALISDTGWPCPWVSPTGRTFHFSDIIEKLGQDYPARTTLVIHQPTIADC